MPDSMRGEDGFPVNAVYGFCRFLAEFVERSDATHVGIGFDESLTSSFRNQIYPQYKMNRELPPEELSKQFSLCRRVAEAAGFYCVGHHNYEADDLIASMALEMRNQGFRNVIVSGDKDLAQLLRGNDLWWDFARNQHLDAARVKDKFGVPPEAIQDYLGLCGDAVDNIPGVPGVGPKTASALLAEFGSMEELYQNLSSVPYLKIRGAKTLGQKLQKHHEQALLSKQLATLAYDAPTVINGTGAQELKRSSAEVNSLQELSQIIGGRGDGLFRRLVESSRRSLS